MKFTFFTEPVTFCIIQNYYTKDETEIILQALEELKPELQPPENTGAARNINGQVRKNNKGLFIENEEHVLIKLNRKLYGEVTWELCKNNWFYDYLKQDVYDKTLVSYYENGGYYKPHKDKSVLTAIYYIWKEPPQFENGDLYFGDFRVPIENNCLLVFPSSTEHEVKHVKGEGRWAISQFISLKQDDSIPIYHFPNCMQVNDFQRIKEITANGHWTFTGHSYPGRQNTKFWFMDLDNNPFFKEYLKGYIEHKTKKKFRSLQRVYANGQFHGQDGQFHQDEHHPDSWTFMLYTNTIDQDDIENWGGTTQFKTRHGILTQFPYTNHGILFKADLWHRGLAPSRHVNDLRVTIAWKLIE